MSSSPDRRGDDRVLRGSDASAVASADFDVDLRSALPVPSAVVTRAREAARTAGYADGWAQGQQAAKLAAQARADQVAAAERAAAQGRAEVAQRALSALGKAAADLDARRAPALAEISRTVLAAAVEVAEAIVGYELANAENSGLAAVRRAIAMVPEAGPVTVRLHPADRDGLIGPDGSTYTFEGRDITVKADPTLHSGDAVAEYGVTTIDATLTAAVSRVREVLSR